MANNIADLWRTFPAFIPEFVGHQATHEVWERHLAHCPVRAMQPNWQALEANDIPEQAVWGLQSVTLHTAVSEMGDEWPGEWPDILPAEKSTITHTNACFGEPLLHAQGIALYQIQSPQGLDWVAQCMFTGLGRLQHLTFVKMHDWKPLAVKYAEPVAELSTDQGPDSEFPISISAAGSLAPASGWYEAILPNGHPMQSFFAVSDTRLVFREPGERFPMLGVSPKTDESLVQWVWLRAD